MSEKNIRNLYETIAQIIGERENVKITVEVTKKENEAA
jgi:hypothetical protein